MWGLQLANEERLKCMSCKRAPEEPPCCAARAFFRAAVSLQEQAAIAATAVASKSGNGKGQYVGRQAAASKPYTALGGNRQVTPYLIRMLGWWARLEMHLG